MTVRNISSIYKKFLLQLNPEEGSR